MKNIGEKQKEAVEALKQKRDVKPELGLILGSGLGELADHIENPVVVDYEDIPHFPKSTVAGHAGTLVIGTWQGKTVAAMKGRFHYYEGHSMQDVTFPVRVMKGLGVNTLLITNACGGMNPSFAPGDIMVIDDHLNMTGDNPLIGPNDPDMGPRFPDMSRAYSPELRTVAEEKAAELDIKVQHGVYAGITGPSYMTPAEVKMLRQCGADAVGMSTVPEVIAANQMGMRVLGLSCITDMAIGEELEPLTHDDVVAVAARTKPVFKNLVQTITASL
ncbi:purine-nucleoside phosphorylase [Salibacterium halotolerans]|uniref:Purine nucleoside phosphorylase n=1 Tax=Salibacterium halotolerans TaxID=1884432 RepID=A0A1I5R2M9_9BACI|nr:purine-nucleoside phosphorylase [Salibacterium halotolerans]SFP52762.1 purine-nucleoside phosphorylase [Salibacterium halotolerans]